MDLTHRKCKPCAGGTSPLTPEEVARFLELLEGWSSTSKAISKVFKFNNFHETMAFVNALAWISHREDHHPDMTVGYAKCAVQYSTHAIGGLSENDFICAAKADSLLQL